MNPDILAAMTAFARTAELRSITGAAHLLGVTPAAVSQTIRKLEARLGVRLFERTTRSVNLTEAGRAYWERVSPLLTGMAQATEDLQMQASVPGGLLRITLPMVAGQLLIEPLLGDFARLHPHITLELAYQDALVDIVKEGFDAGIRLGESLQRDMIAVPLTREFRLRTYASPDYLARRGTPQVPADLLQHNCINYRLASTGAPYRWEFLERRRIVALSVSGSLIVNHWMTMLEAAAQGVGVCHVLPEAAARWVAEGRLVEVLQKFSPSFDGLYIYHPRREQLPVKTRLFIDFLKARLAA
ncbi:MULTISPECIES: LysR family transcriptional regulator [Aquincola]|uniref:LysR family transcriptional regulator n=1 Tax=Aquincola TaxID=391952 RepID=UPI0006150A1F|nr:MULTISPECIES: LysR family transcriptional regulator [Aquincola]MCR5865993.1 LysR family transcriptional regulator [Aquincola sp. J276]